MPKLVSIDAQSYPALTSQSLHATIGPLQDNGPLFHYVIGISGILPYNRNVTLQTLELFSAYSRLYNAVASPASRLRSAGSLTKMFYGYAMFIGVNSQKGSRYLSFPVYRSRVPWIQKLTSKPKLVSIDAQSYPALTSQSLCATIGPLQDN